MGGGDPSSIRTDLHAPGITSSDAAGCLAVERVGIRMQSVHAESAARARSASWPSLSIVAIAVPTTLSVAAAALVERPSQPARAIALGVAAALIWIVLDGLAPFARRRARNVVSLQAFVAVAAVLCVSWNLTGLGLAPVSALAACAVATVTSGFTLAIARRAGFLPHAERVLVVGSGIVADALIAGLQREGRSAVVGCIDDGSDASLLGDLDAFERVVAQHHVTAVMFAYSRVRDGRLAELAARSRELGLAVAIVPRLFEQFDQRLRTRHVAGLPLMTVEPLAYQTQLPLLTRAFDVLAAAVLLVLTAPIWLLISIAILIEEPGAIFYRAERVGLNGQMFRMFKFRKMRRDASGAKLTILQDPRFTRIGGLLARTKLDELPQLLNVVRGEMGLVGPRPEDPSYVALYPAEFAEIQRVRPGITGLSQIQYRDESALLVGDDYDELYRNALLPRKITLDRYYAKRHCIGLDVRILMWTLVAVVAGARVRRNELTGAVGFEVLDSPAIVE
jgi:lipopolysaccharide/colanic/teichoic acid biosynthesis glycosyltransferase